MIQYENMRDDLSARYLIVNPLDPLTAAGSVTQALDATISDLDSVKIAAFPSDELFDFRAQRPIVEYQDGKLANLVQPELQLSLVTDIEGENFLYLSGQEPDYRWESVTADLIDAVRRFRVDEVITFAAMPAAIPHTRPADMLMRSTRQKDGVKYVPGHAVHPGALTDFFEYYAGKLGISVVNIRVRVPFYLAQLGEPFLAGALAALRMTASLGGPKLPLGDLERYEDRADAAYQELLENSPDLAELISSMEHEYDVNPSQQAFATSDQELLRVPSVEEIGLAAEKFLAVHGSSSLADVFEPEPDLPQSKQKKRRSGKFLGIDFPLLGNKHSADEDSADGDAVDRLADRAKQHKREADDFIRSDTVWVQRGTQNHEHDSARDLAGDLAGEETPGGDNIHEEITHGETVAEQGVDIADDVDASSSKALGAEQPSSSRQFSSRRGKHHRDK